MSAAFQKIDNVLINTDKVTYITVYPDEIEQKSVIRFGTSIVNNDNKTTADYINIDNKDVLKLNLDRFIEATFYNKNNKVYINPKQVICIKVFDNKVIFTFSSPLSNFNNNKNNSYKIISDFVTTDLTDDLLEQIERLI